MKNKKYTLTTLFKNIAGIYSSPDNVEMVSSETTISNDELENSKIIKQVNEQGIAGFVFALVLPLYAMVWFPNGLPNNILNQNSDSKSFWILMFFLVFAIVLSIAGVSKNSKHFNKALAYSGLFLNLANLLDLLRQII